MLQKALRYEIPSFLMFNCETGKFAIRILIVVCKVYCKKIVYWLSYALRSLIYHTR